MGKIKAIKIGDVEIDVENAPSVNLSNFNNIGWAIDKTDGETDKEFIDRLERDYGLTPVNKKE